MIGIKRDPTAFLGQEIDELKSKNLDWKIRTLQTASQPHCKVGGKDVILFCSNNYLNLSTHSKLIQASIETTKNFGAGAGAVPVISGTMDLHEQFQEKLAKFKRVEASLLYPTGFAVNSGLIPQLVGDGDIVISDELNHGSIIDGVRLSKAEKMIFKHADLGSLEEVLKQADAKNARRILVITDGVFSMDGDIAPLPGIVKLCDQYGAMTFVDDCHGEGVLGDGRGIVHHFKLQDKVHVEGGSMGKAFGVMGGTVAGSQDLIDFAFNKSRTWLLSTAHPPGSVAAMIAALEVVESEPRHVKNLWDNTRYIKKELQSLGFNTGKSETPIIPVIVGDPGKARDLSNDLFGAGIFCFPIVFPMVARELSRVRLQINAQHSKGDLDAALNAFEKTGRRLKII